MQGNAALIKGKQTKRRQNTEQTLILGILRKYRVEIIQKLFIQGLYFFSRCRDHIYNVGSEELLKSKGLHAVH